MNFFNKLIFVFLFFTAFTLTFGQSKFNGGASFNLNIPIGSFNDYAKTGIGGSIIFEYVFNEKISATVLGSYNSFNSEIPLLAVGGATYKISITSIPVLAGIRYYFNPNAFGIVIVGSTFLRANADVSNIYSKEKLSTDYNSKISAGIGGGFRTNLSEQSVFEISGVYQYVQDDFSTISLSASVIILFGNL